MWLVEQPAMGSVGSLTYEYFVLPRLYSFIGKNFGERIDETVANESLKCVIFRVHFCNGGRKKRVISRLKCMKVY
jgi:hypothetical protein